MLSINKIGIWMDHSNAHLIEFKKGQSSPKIIDSNFSQKDKERALRKGEQLMHNKRQHHETVYYHKLVDTIIKYEEVILFGPTDAKVELFNILQSDLRSDKIKIEVKTTDNMTENQKIAFVRNHF
jgi:hypothetical protein